MRKRRAGLPLSRERGRGAEAGIQYRHRPQKREANKTPAAVNLSILADNRLRPRHQASANPKYAPRLCKQNRI